MIKSLLNPDEESSPKTNLLNEENLFNPPINKENASTAQSEPVTETQPATIDESSAEIEESGKVFEIPETAKFFAKPEETKAPAEEPKIIPTDDLDSLLQIEEETRAPFAGAESLAGNL